MKKRLLRIGIILAVTICFVGCTSALNSEKVKNESRSVKVAAKAPEKTKEEIDNEKPDKSIIRPGDKGEDVVRIQTRLKKYGYNVTADGDYGDEVDYEVMEFQHKHNIEISGTVSRDTLAALYETPTDAYMYKADSTQAALSSDVIANKSAYESVVNSEECTSYTNNYILVNLEEQQVYIFYGTNHNWKLINTFSCASGKSSTPTVRGHFNLGVKGLYFRSGSAYCKYFSQITGNYLFHSILYDSNGNVLDSTLGEKASHGCIRLALDNAKYIYDNIPIGSGIWIK